MTQNTYYSNFSVPDLKSELKPQVINLIKSYKGTYTKEETNQATVFYTVFYNEDLFNKFITALDELIPDRYRF